MSGVERLTCGNGVVSALRGVRCDVLVETVDFGNVGFVDFSRFRTGNAHDFSFFDFQSVLFERLFEVSEDFPVRNGIAGFAYGIVDRTVFRVRLFEFPDFGFHFVRYGLYAVCLVVLHVVDSRFGFHGGIHEVEFFLLERVGLHSGAFGLRKAGNCGVVEFGNGFPGLRYRFSNGFRAFHGSLYHYASAFRRAFGYVLRAFSRRDDGCDVDYRFDISCRLGVFRLEFVPFFHSFRNRVERGLPGVGLQEFLGLFLSGFPGGLVRGNERFPEYVPDESRRLSSGLEYLGKSRLVGACYLKSLVETLLGILVEALEIGRFFGFRFAVSFRSEVILDSFRVVTAL